MKTLVLIGIIALFLAGCGAIVENKADVETPKEEPTKESVGVTGISKQRCIDSGGSWNECGSPCAGAGADFCIQMCQAQCECDSMRFRCPEGYKCRLSGKIANEVGVCIRTT